jgi:dienelactone hydrolase
VEIESSEVKRIRDIRHILTHQRGELRTEKQRQEFTALDDVMAIYATLRESDVQKHLDVLEAKVRGLDHIVFGFSWGGQRVKKLVIEDQSSS